MNKNTIRTTIIPALPTQLVEDTVVAAFAPLAYALPTESVRRPHANVARFLEDAFQVLGAAREQLTTLDKVGVSAQHLEVLEHRIAALKTVQTCWSKERMTGVPAQVVTAIEGAEQLRAEIFGVVRFALARQPMLGGVEGALSMTDGLDGIVEDLHVLESILDQAKPILASMNVDVAGYVSKIGNMLTTIEKPLEAVAMTDVQMNVVELRDRLFTLTLDAAFGVCDAAFAVLGHDRAQKNLLAPFTGLSTWGWSI